MNFIAYEGYTALSRRQGAQNHGVSAVALAIAETAFEAGGAHRQGEAASPRLPYGLPPLQIQLATGDQVFTGKALNEKNNIITAGIAGTSKKAGIQGWRPGSMGLQRAQPRS
jgi:hypothetical protein